ncbi:DUF485 domain-containing protein [Paraburkholderia hospita]|uniref:DUF485 domain-containing protein n=1 Tax=Paraburkholderia hospita TaxID=169430 RepID=UPI000B345405|nr:DUF485 domain-containing protein [Paraburkholderia hospita]OUL77844.1 hypothetical protein CA603_35260 [Paraburkholderia hospita]
MRIAPGGPYNRSSFGSWLTSLAEKIKSSATYRELVRKRSKLGWTLTALVLVVYYGYVRLIAFNKDLLAAKMGAGVMTWGMPIGLFVIVFTVVITGFYVHRANSAYDELTERIKREAV